MRRGNMLHMIQKKNFNEIYKKIPNCVYIILILIFLILILIFGATKEIKESGFIPTFEIQGQVYHRIGSILPMSNYNHQFLQI